MSFKRTDIHGNFVRHNAAKVGAFALAATLALGSVPVAFAATAPAASGNQSAYSVAIDADAIELGASGDSNTLAVANVFDQISEQAVTNMTAMETVVDQVNAEKKAAAKAAKKAMGKTISKTLKVANSLIGTPYVYGGSTPSGFDCSGFTMYCYAQAGVKLTHNAQAQYNETLSVSTDSMKPGDLVFFGGSTGSISHVGIYVGDGKFIHSPSTGEYVRIDKLSDRTNFVGATRPVQ